jgi:hypothetical protein
MQKLHVFLLGTLAVLPLCSFGAVNVDFRSGNFTSDGQHLATGKNGHAEAVLDAQGSVIRFGSNTQAEVGNEREVTLTKGLLLVSSGEGGVRGDLGGQSFSLHPGELIIQRGDGTRDIVQVNLHSLAGSCALLVGDGFKPLQFAGSIDKAVVQQDKVFAAEHHHFAGQHVAGVAHGEAPSFLANLFSGHGSAANNFGSSVSGVPTVLSQGGSSNGNSTTSIAGGTLTFDAGGTSGNTSSVGLVSAGGLNLNSNASALTAGSSSQGLTFNGSSGASLVFNNNFNTSGLTISGATIVSGASSVGINANSYINTNAVGTLSLGNNVGATISGVTNNLNVINLSTAPGTLTLSPGGEPTITYNGQVYHGQDAVNLINSLQHPTTPSTP